MKYLTQREIFDGLVETFKILIAEKYAVKDDLNRAANIYAVKNTVISWRKQYEG